MRNSLIRDLPTLLKKAIIKYQQDEPFRLSAVVAYYAVLSFPALLVIVISLAGFVFGEAAVQGRITSEIGNIIGPGAAESVETMIANASKSQKSLAATLIGVAVLIFGATGVFYQIQQSLNKIWGVKPDPKAGIKKLAIDRALSLGIVITTGFLLLISLLLTAALSALNDWLVTILPKFLSYVFYILNILLSLAVITALFAMMFKVMPDVSIEWKTVWPGAVITALLFEVSKFLLGLYFGKADPASVYGAAGSIVLILLWVSYSCLVLFYGAEFTAVYARYYGGKIKLAPHAVPDKRSFEEGYGAVHK